MYFFLPPPLPIPIITCECLHTLAHSNGTGGGDNRHFIHRERWIFNELPLSLGSDKNLRIFNTWIKFERYETVPPTPPPTPQTIEHWCLCFSFSFHPYLGVLLSKRFYVPGTYNILTLYSLQLSFNVSINIFFLKLTRKKSKLNTNQLLFQKIMALSTAITQRHFLPWCQIHISPICLLSFHDKITTHKW